MGDYRIRLSPHSDLWWIEKKKRFLWWSLWEIYSKCSTRQEAEAMVKFYEEQQSKGSGDE